MITITSSEGRSGGLGARCSCGNPRSRQHHRLAAARLPSSGETSMRSTPGPPAARPWLRCHSVCSLATGQNQSSLVTEDPLCSCGSGSTWDQMAGGDGPLCHRPPVRDWLHILRLSASKYARGNSNLGEKNWRHHHSGLQALSPSCGDQYRLVLAQKGTQRSMGQKRKLRNESARHAVGKRQSLQQTVLGKVSSHSRRKEPGPFSYTVRKTKSKTDKRPKYETRNHKNPRGEHRR